MSCTADSRLSVGSYEYSKYRNIDALGDEDDAEGTKTKLGRR